MNQTRMKKKMKQHITVDQLNELSEKGKERLGEWWKPKQFDLYTSTWMDKTWLLDEKEYEAAVKLMGNWKKKAKVLPLLTIGQMIEFLDEHGKFINIWRALREDWLIVINDDTHVAKPELADALWEACKEILEK